MISGQLTTDKLCKNCKWYERLQNAHSDEPQNECGNPDLRFLYEVINLPEDFGCIHFEGKELTGLSEPNKPEYEVTKDMINGLILPWAIIDRFTKTSETREITSSKTERALEIKVILDNEIESYKITYEKLPTAEYLYKVLTEQFKAYDIKIEFLEKYFKSRGIEYSIPPSTIGLTAKEASEGNGIL